MVPSTTQRPLWAAALRHATVCISASARSDGRPAPFSLFTGLDYEFDKHHHVFGAKAEYTLVAEKRKSKHDLTGCEGIWVGRSTTTPGADLVIPISWVGSESRYELGPTIHVHGAKVFDKDFPLRFGPDKLRDESQGDFNGFMDDFYISALRFRC